MVRHDDILWRLPAPQHLTHPTPKSHAWWRARAFAQLAPEGFGYDLFTEDGYIGSVSLNRGFWVKDTPPRQLAQHEGWARYFGGELVHVKADLVGHVDEWEAYYKVTAGPFKGRKFYAPHCPDVGDGYIGVPVDAFNALNF